jgi:hypothetical protein
MGKLRRMMMRALRKEQYCVLAMADFKKTIADAVA